MVDVNGFSTLTTSLGNIHLIKNFQTIYGSSTGDNVTGSNSDEVFHPLAGTNTFNGLGGNDTLAFIFDFANTTIDMIAGTASSTLGTTTFSNVENIDGAYTGTGGASDGSDTIFGNNSDNRIRGDGGLGATGTGNDIINGRGGNDTIWGDGGNDTIDGGDGNDWMSGDTGTDTVTYATATSGVTVSLALLTAQNTVGAGLDTLSNFENLTGSNFNDTLTGDGSANIITGSDGDDTLVGGLGNDTLNGGNNIDTVSYITATGAVTVNLALGTAAGAAGDDTLIAIENITASGFADTLIGNSVANIINAGNGDDSINAGAGNDTVNGQDGNDIIGGGDNNDTLDGGNGNDTINGDADDDLIIGGAGNDILDGGTGIDTVSYNGATGAVTVNLLTTSATGAWGNDTVTNFENIIGSDFSDSLTDSDSNNVISGGLGDDTIVGRGGNDTYDGGGGTGDILSYQFLVSGVTFNTTAGTATGASAGNDTFTNFEILRGSVGTDTFALAANNFFNFTTIDGNIGSADRVNLSNGSGNLNAISGAQMNSLFDNIDILDMTAATRSGTLNFTTADIDGMNGTDTAFTLRVTSGFGLSLDSNTVNTSVAGTQNINIGSGITVTVEVI